MPELPEVERVRLSLAHRLLGQRIASVTLHRPDIVTGDRSDAALLANQTVTDIRRHGKQLAILSNTGRCLCIHLGMTGSLCYHAPTSNTPVNHRHVIWTLDSGDRFEFRDPRRFGGIWTFNTFDTLTQHRWSTLGPDALNITLTQPNTTATLAHALQQTSRPIKSALLDQSIVAGLGNIYVDELLFLCRVHPLTPAHRLRPDLLPLLIHHMQALLARAIDAGGSTLRDYVDAEGHSGGFQNSHQVYGRAGSPCLTCATPLRSKALQGRTTVWCPNCQPKRPSHQGPPPAGSSTM